ncbi:hypothetical protein HF313_16335 [Massilia atriviolacea]|uniref:hypothetical protein n=1 Tax=Massilia atriviolacea TaxID=2495579 RepID=UPI0013E0A97C|nr:hypothetical protein [Massilia atriviolacea]
MPDESEGEDAYARFAAFPASQTGEMNAMCNMHKKMKGTRTPEGPPAIIDEQMKSISPDMLQKHMTVMRKCQ